MLDRQHGRPQGRLTIAVEPFRGTVSQPGRGVPAQHRPEQPTIPRGPNSQPRVHPPVVDLAVHVSAPAGRTRTAAPGCAPRQSHSPTHHAPGGPLCCCSCAAGGPAAPSGLRPSASRSGLARRRPPPRPRGTTELIVRDIDGTRIAYVLPVIPDGVPPLVREGITRRRLAALEDKCPCGGRSPLNRATRRRLVKDRQVTHLGFVHEDGCPTVTAVATARCGTG